MDSLLSKVNDFVREKLSHFPEVLSHTERVRRYALYLASKEGANMKKVEIAALLHDIGYIMDSRSHKEYSVKISRDFFAKLSVSNPDPLLNAIEHGKQPQTLEAKIICDADALERLGPIGLIRLSIYFYRDYDMKEPSEIAGKIKEFMESSINGLSTSTAKEIALSKVLDCKDFFKHFDVQLNSLPEQLLAYKEKQC